MTRVKLIEGKTAEQMSRDSLVKVRFVNIILADREMSVLNMLRDAEVSLVTLKEHVPGGSC